MSSLLRLSSSAVTLGKRAQGTEGELSEKADTGLQTNHNDTAKMIL
jgi:hypothetical protein